MACRRTFAKSLSERVMTQFTDVYIRHSVSMSHMEGPLQWRHNEHDGVSNHQPHGCLLNRLFSRRSKKTSKLRVTDLCEGNSTVTGEFPAQRASNAENVSISWRHHAKRSSNPWFEWYNVIVIFERATMMGFRAKTLAIYPEIDESVWNKSHRFIEI